MKGEENILKVTKKIKIGVQYKLLLIIIAILIVGLIFVSLNLSFKLVSPREVYLKTIDESVQKLYGIFEEIDRNLSKNISVASEISFDVDANGDSVEQIANLINKMAIKSKLDINYKQKKENMNLDIFYNNNDLVSADFIVDGNNMYFDLGNLYDKTIKLPVEGIDKIWESYDIDSYKTIVSELAKILKHRLLPEYFAQEELKIDVDGKEVDVLNYKMMLDSEDMITIINGVMEDVVGNTRLLNVLAKVFGVANEEIVATLKDNKISAIEENVNFSSNIYINKLNKNLEKVVVGLKNYDPSSENECNMLDCISGLNDNVGTFMMNDDGAIFSFVNSKGAINFGISDEKIKLTVSYDGNTVELVCNINDTKTDGYIKIYNELEGKDVQINFNSEVKEIKNINLKPVHNYIVLEHMTDSDYSTIIVNATQNQNIMSLIQEIMALDLVKSFVID